MNENKIDLDLAEDPNALSYAPAGGKINLETDPLQSPLPPDIAKRRAQKADFALGTDSPGEKTLEDGLVSGSEVFLRQQAAKKQEAKDAEARAGLLKGILSTAGRITPGDVAAVEALAAPTKVNPDSVFEDKFGQAYMNMVLMPYLYGPQGRGMNDPNKAAKVFDSAETAARVVSFVEQLRTLNENLTVETSQQSWMGYGADVLKTFFPGYTEWKFWNSKLPSGVGYGSQLRAEVRHIWSLPEADRIGYVKARVDQLKKDNTVLAKEFLDSVISFPASAEFMGNLSTILNAAVFPTGKAAYTAGKTPVKRAAEEIVSPAAKVPETPIIPEMPTGGGGARFGYGTQDGTSFSYGGYNAPAVPELPSVFRDRMTTPVGTSEATLDPARKSPFGRLEGDWKNVPQSQQKAEPMGMSGSVSFDVPSVPAWRPAPDIIAPLESPLSAKFAEGELKATVSVVGDAIKAIANPSQTIEGVLDRNGLVKQAGEVMAGKDLQAIAEGTLGQADRANPYESIKNRLPAIFNPAQFVTEVGSFSREFAQRLTKTLTENSAAGRFGLSNVARVNRGTTEAVESAFEAAERQIREKFSRDHGNGSIIGIKRNYGKDNLSSTNTFSVQFGDVTGKLFETREQALNARDMVLKLSPEDAIVRDRGNGFYLEITRPLDETDDAWRNAMITTKNQTPQNLWNYFLGSLRTADDKVSPLARENRKLAQASQNALQNQMKEIADNLQAKLPGGKGLSRKESGELSRLFNYHNTEKKFAESLSDFEKDFRMLNKTKPSEAQAQAYFSYVQLNDFDWLMRNLSYHRDWSRQGVMQFQLSDVKDGAPRTSDFFKGKEVASLPPYSDGYWLAVWQKDGKHSYIRTNGRETGTPEALESVNKALAEGCKIIQVAEPDALYKFAGSHRDVRFVIVKDVAQKPLDMFMIPYNPGGHRVYQPENFLKQAIVSDFAGQKIYRGDTIIIGQYTKAEVDKFGKFLNEARLLIKNGEVDKAAVLLNKNLPAEFSYENFMKRVSAGQWSLDYDFISTKAGKTISQTDKTFLGRHGIRDNDADSIYNMANNVDKKFTGERDELLWTIKETGSEAKPQISLESAALIDPMLTINRSIANATHSLLVNDYRQFALDSWAAEFWDVVKVSANEPFLEQKVKANPLHYILHADNIDKSQDPVKAAAALNSRRAIMDYLNMDTTETAQLKAFQGHLNSWVYEKIGQKYSDPLSAHQLAALRDPVARMRAVAFDLKLGLLNWVQLPLQAMTGAHSYMVAGPQLGLKGSAATWGGKFLRNADEESTRAFFNKWMKGKSGWTERDFVEAHQQGHRSGWFLIQGDNAWRDDVSDPRLIRGVVGQALEYGRVFFQEGERLAREQGWYTAFAEWRQKNPVRKFDDKAMAEVLDRADLFTMNMTRASAANWQTGLMSIPTQFMAYPIRMAEQFWSGRLTTAEKARVLVGNAALYGLPIAAGTTTGLVPVYDLIRKEAIERGYDLNNPWMKFMMEGGLSTMVSLATGQDYNVPARFGPNSNSPIFDYWNEEKSAGQILSGAAGSTIGSIAKTMLGARAYAFSALFGTEGAPMKGEDFVDIAKNISSFNTGYKAFVAYSYGQYLSKTEGVIANDMTGTDALMTALGLTRLDITDTWKYSQIMKDTKKHQATAEKEAIKEFQRAIRAAAAGDENGAADYMKRARFHIVGGRFLPSDQAKIWERAMEGMGPYMQKVRHDFNFKTRLDILQRNIDSVTQQRQ